MSRSTKFIMFALVAWYIAVPVTAQAQVLQIDGQGYRWITDKTPAQSTASAAVNESPAYTHAVIAAGPNEWQAWVAQMAVKYEISPALLEAVIWQESRWHPAATSRAGAHGLAQLMPATARQMGVDISNPHANIEGGARYLRMQLDTFGGDIEKALAAYNAGPGRVDQAQGIPRIPETQNYVVAVMARLAERVWR
jgi:soluble lytic murein transglycosylase-like protein